MRRASLLVLLLAPALPACPFVQPQPTATAYSRMYAGPVAVRVLNASARPICFVHVSPAGQGDWGDDWLGSSETIPSGMMRQLGVAPGVYDVRLDDCQQSPVQMQMAVDLRAPVELVVFESAPPPLAPTPGFARLQLVAMRPLPQASYASSSSSEPAPPAVSFDGGGRGAAPEPATPAGPEHYSLTLHNSCSQTVGLYHGTGGGRPPFATGTYGSIGSNTTESFSGFAPETFWIVDESRNGVSSFTASGGSQRIEITSGCSGFAAD